MSASSSASSCVVIRIATAMQRAGLRGVLVHRTAAKMRQALAWFRGLSRESEAVPALGASTSGVPAADGVDAVIFPPVFGCLGAFCDDLCTAPHSPEVYHKAGIPPRREGRRTNVNTRDAGVRGPHPYGQGDGLECVTHDRSSIFTVACGT